MLTFQKVLPSNLFVMIDLTSICDTYPCPNIYTWNKIKGPGTI